MNYEEMSDFEINGKVAELIYGSFETYEDSVYVEPKHSGDNIVPVSGIFDPCNSWADAGPIIESNHISIMSYVRHNPGCVRLEWWEADRFADMNVKHSNPLRAAMIVLLMMQEIK